MAIRPQFDEHPSYSSSDVTGRSAGCMLASLSGNMFSRIDLW